ncbi:MAG: hypothetical protein ACKUBY_02540 [Candidatus Moraniibacteriota bacterium]
MKTKEEVREFVKNRTMQVKITVVIEKTFKYLFFCFQLFARVIKISGAINIAR